ncbi:hypothetical protein PFICI_01197 [Pestalotiopsis fici W106-1]|uniref:RHD domain-containing protein n=1 Tax=Pestalotiopsis fici (strain W106-1 / CGMCC3.15140) TaxID=1229662 RepID=W3XN07_PESFW|nr:uncharacterized protein PFICI_01197 [Pestalotiopsis fici W106-1]ETS87369.1 hypothetical protein PFICI_01197 [Pestalotiopsis fici W106-1]
MAYHKSPSPVDKMIVSPGRRAVDFCKETWRRVTKSPKSEERPLHISTPIFFKHTEHGVAKKESPDPAPTRPDDVTDDHAKVVNVKDTGDGDEKENEAECGDLAMMPLAVTLSSTVSSLISEPAPVATPLPASQVSESSPAILDKDWRRFEDTPVKSSPSYYLGKYARGSDSQGTIVNRPRSTSAATTNLSILESSTERDFGDPEPSWQHTSRPRSQPRPKDSGSSFSTYQATPPVQFPRQAKQKNFGFLYHREVRSSGHKGEAASVASSSQVSLATPTPAVRTAHYHYQHQPSRAAAARPHSAVIQRHVSDSVIGTEDAGDWMTIADTVGDMSGLQGGGGEDGGDAADSINGHASDKWSAVSVRGQSSTMDNIIFPESRGRNANDDEIKVKTRLENNVVTPVKQRRKVSFADQLPAGTTTTAAAAATGTTTAAAATEPFQSRVVIRRGVDAQNQERPETLQVNRSTRTHPRYSGSFDVDVARRRISTPIGPAVLMDS